MITSQTNTVVAFPRAQRVVADLRGDALLRRCRIAAVVAGCDGGQRETILRAARIQAENGGDGVSILRAARELAQQLTHPGAPQ